MLPHFCYNKAFWLLFGLVITSFGSAIMAVWAELSDIREDVSDVDHQVSLNNVPELKQTIEKRLDTQEKKIDQLIEQGNTNYKLLCKISNGEC